MLRHDHHAFSVDLDHIGEIIIALVAAPSVALVGQYAERLARVMSVRAHPADRLFAGDVPHDAIDLADFLALLVRRQVGHLDVVGGAMTRDFVAGLMQGLYGLRPFLHRKPVDVDRRRHLVAFQHFENAPYAGIAAVVRMRKRNEIDLQALRLLEMSPACEGFKRDGERGADLFAIGPFGLGASCGAHEQSRSQYCGAPKWVRFGQNGRLRVGVLGQQFNISADADKTTLSVDDA